MEVSITTISKNGQIVIPSDIRVAMGIGPSEKFLVVGEGDTIVLKRLSRESLKREMNSLFAYFSGEFSKAGITHEEAIEEIRMHRQKKSPSHARNG